MAEILHRSFSADIAVRGIGSGRTLTGICVPFDSPTADGALPFSETFTRGAFAKTIAQRASKVKLLASHDAMALPIGRATLLREDRVGLYGEFLVSDTPRGNEVLALARDGALDAFSVGFVPLQDTWSADRSTRTVLEAKLLEVSAVTWGAYPEAKVHAVRSGGPDFTAQRQRLELLLRRDSTAFDFYEGI